MKKFALILVSIFASLVMAAQVSAAMNCYIIGSATDAAGVPVGGATISTHPSKEAPQVSAVRTLPEGKFMIAVPAGTPYWVKAVKAGQPTSWSAATGTCASGGWTQINVQMK